MEAGKLDIISIEKFIILFSHFAYFHGRDSGAGVFVSQMGKGGRETEGLEEEDGWMDE